MSGGYSPATEALLTRTPGRTASSLYALETTNTLQPEAAAVAQGHVVQVSAAADAPPAECLYQLGLSHTAARLQDTGAAHIRRGGVMEHDSCNTDM